MAATHPFNPVMHCVVTDFLGVNTLANRIINQGLYVNTSLFPSPPVILPVFETANAQLTTLISQAKGNSNMVKERNATAVIVHHYLEQLILYSASICNHSVSNITLSGFDASNEPQPSAIPPTPVISRVTEGRGAATYKIYLERKRKKALIFEKAKTKGKTTRYYVQTTTTPLVDGSWVTQLEGAASTKIILTKGIVAGKNYIRVYAINSAGQSPNSTPFPFVPQM